MGHPCEPPTHDPLGRPKRRLEKFITAIAIALAVGFPSRKAKMRPQI